MNQSKLQVLVVITNLFLGDSLDTSTTTCSLTRDGARTERGNEERRRERERERAG